MFFFTYQGCQQYTKGDNVDGHGLGKLDTETIFKNPDGSYYLNYTNGDGNRSDILCNVNYLVKPLFKYLIHKNRNKFSSSPVNFTHNLFYYNKITHKHNAWNTK